MEKKLSFEIAESPVIYDVNGQVYNSKTHKVIHKVEDPSSVISVMKNSYTPMFNSDFMESVDRLGEISGMPIEGYSEFGDGKIVMGFLKNNIEDFKIGGHKIQDYLMVGSSFDGRYPFFVGTSTVLIRCQNQFSRISKVTKIKHTKSAPLRREELFQTLETYFLNRKKMYENFEKFIKIEVSPEVRQLAIDKIMQVSEEDRLEEKISTRKQNLINTLQADITTEFNDLGENVWALFNGVTRFTTHHINPKERVFGNVFGTPAEYNQRAYEFALSFA